MSNAISPQLLAQMYAQESADPFLMLVTLSHAGFSSTQRLVNNSADIISRGDTFTAFPMKIILPTDDGETSREVSISFDNVGRDLIDEIRTITTPIDVIIEMVLASNPNQVQIPLEGLQIRNVTYDKSRITARLYMDDFLNTSMTSEQYTPQNFPGLF